ncbi:hypothetical protein [Thalassomonas haliotis]|uniref:Uncharacterized protein n=1 Tax=Thalassomonas haliotis TaxID=485448 RepID=A0ABY7VFG3_9GAMM|nr:hypothetical protein [Thalassomonas haliotis]WDE12210.1 hypothetical protein H3N35_01610 [Thalassomonas haliotis]
MANPNDMPELHPVKASLTENIPARRQPPVANVSNTSKHDLAASCVSLTVEGGREHV